MAKEIDILRASASARDKELIKKLADVSLDVVISGVESATDIPYIGNLIKLIKTSSNLKDYFFMKKLAKFMKETDDIPQKRIEKFLASLKEKDSARISSFLLHVLANAEDEDKAIALGKLYKARILEEIDNYELLKMSSIINRSYYADFQFLDHYIEANEDLGDIAGTFYSLGLLTNRGNLYQTKGYGSETRKYGPTKYQLNGFGLKFHTIINSKE